MKILFKDYKHYHLFGLKSNGKIVSYQISNNGTFIESQYRYFMILIPSYGLCSGSTVQFSKLRFFNGNNVNNCYSWCNDMINFSQITDYVSIIKASGTRGTAGEELQYGLVGMGGPSDGKDHDEVEEQPGVYRMYGKMCYTSIFSSNQMVTVNGAKYACYALDVDAMNFGRRIDIKMYNKWCWHSANDTYSTYGSGSGDRNMSNFSLYMSNDRNTWQLMDSASGISKPNEGNFKMIYSNNIYPHYTIDASGKKKYTTITLNI